MPSSWISPLSLHDALPISSRTASSPRRWTAPSATGFPTSRWPATRAATPTNRPGAAGRPCPRAPSPPRAARPSSSAAPASTSIDRKSTRLNSSHTVISYAVLLDLPPFPTRRSSDLFQDGVISQAVDRAVSNGVPYFALAGNSGRNSYESSWRGGPALPSGSIPSASGAPFFFGGTSFDFDRSEEHTSELQSHSDLVCRPPGSPPFPYTTLFRSLPGRRHLPGGGPRRQQRGSLLRAGRQLGPQLLRIVLARRAGPALGLHPLRERRALLLRRHQLRLR